MIIIVNVKSIVKFHTSVETTRKFVFSENHRNSKVKTSQLLDVQNPFIQTYCYIRTYQLT